MISVKLSLSLFERFMKYVYYFDQLDKILACYMKGLVLSKEGSFLPYSSSSLFNHASLIL